MTIHWYAHHLGDYAKKTRELSLLEHGAYRLLLDHYYTREGAFPNDLPMLYRVCAAITPTERRAVQKILSKYFSHQDGCWYHSRADEEIQKTRNISVVRQKAASKRYANAPANAEQMHTQPTTTTYNHSNYKNGGMNGKPKTGAEEGARLAEMYLSRSKEPLV